MAVCSRTLQGGRAILFFRTKQRAHRMKIMFGLAGLPPSAELHGNMSQTQRLESLELFRKGGFAVFQALAGMAGHKGNARAGEVKFLLSTDVAARGLDILGVQTVVNFDAPRQFANYLHRIGGFLLAAVARAHYASESPPPCLQAERHARGGRARPSRS